jgi:AAA ATPase domain/AAA domain, putative AbiEii toxin, Type IV TA system
MRLKRFTVENYRAFAAEAAVDLRALTLLFGYNSVGKSALMRALPLIAASSNGPPSGGFSLESSVLRGGVFYDLICKLTPTPEVSIGLVWEDTVRGITTAYNAVIRNLGGVQRITSATIRCSDGASIAITWDPGGQAKDADYDVYGFTSETTSLSTPLQFSGLAPVASDAIDPRFNTLLRTVQAGFAAMSSSVYWLEALRAGPTRFEIVPAGRLTLHTDGRGAPAILAADEEGDGKLLRSVSAWYQAATGSRLLVNRGGIGARALFSLALSPVQGDAVMVPLVDTGEGMGQVLPVVTLLAQAVTGDLELGGAVVIEHPELHLHPQAHVALAELACRAASNPHAPPCILETHSESFLLAVQLAIVQRIIPPDAVVVYWIRQGENGASSFEKVEFDLDGYPVGDNWPSGVFREATEQARRLHRARLGNRPFT